MARLLITYYRSDEISAGATLCFYESLFHELERFGNDVMAINMAYYGVFNPNTMENKCHESYLVSEVLKFNPDVIIAFNHHILRAILQATDVPVVIYDGDELRFFADLDVIKKNINRYKVFSIVEDWRQSYLDFGFRDDQVFYMPPGTAITNDSTLTKDKNVSFLGQRRYFLSRKLYELIQQQTNPKCLYDVYCEFLRTGDYDYQKHYAAKAREKLGVDLQDVDLWPLFDQSYLIFANLLDLGLHLGGHESAWCDIVNLVPQIAAAHDRSRVFDLAENQQFYNSSVLSLCPMHPQAKGQGFSWRCYDIMASSACMVSSTSTELIKLTHKWVDLPMFDTPAQAREICLDLLGDKAKREALIAGSNAYIAENGRWEHRFKQMEEILGLTLLDPGKKGSFSKVTEQPLTYELPGKEPAVFIESVQTAAKEQEVQSQKPTAQQQEAVVQQQEPVVQPQKPTDQQQKQAIRRQKQAIRRQNMYRRRFMVKAALGQMHRKCQNPILLLFLAVGEFTTLGMFAAAAAGLFTPLFGAAVNTVFGYITAIGLLMFFAALCVCFFFKFLYKGVLALHHKLKRRL